MSAAVRSLSVACALLLFSGTVNAALLRKASGDSVVATASSADAASLLDARNLAGSVTQVRHLAAQMTAGQMIPQWATPMPKCVLAVNATLRKMQKAYLPAHVAAGLHHSCDTPDVWGDIGGTIEACRDLMTELGKEYNGERNYYTWCRSLTLSSFQSVRTMGEMFESNATLKALRDGCSAECPYLSKIFAASFKFEAFFEKVLMAEKPEGEAGVADMSKMLEISLRQFNQICDWQNKATCSVRTMPESCSSLREAIKGSPAAEELDKDWEMLEQECHGRKRCTKACQGVNAYLTDFTLEQAQMNMQVPMPNTSIGKKHCKHVDRLRECAVYTECETYLSGKLSMGHTSAREYLDSWDGVCGWFKDSCAAQREESCGPQVLALREEWRGNYACLVDEVSDKCCSTLDSVMQCDAQVGCSKHLLDGIPLLGVSGLKERISQQCPNITAPKDYNWLEGVDAQGRRGKFRVINGEDVKSRR